MSVVRVAVVAPESKRGDEEYQNAARAVAYVEEAAQRGVDLVCFPEGYPGPCNGPMDSGGRLKTTPIAILQEAAKTHHVHVTCGNLEETGNRPETYYLCQKLISPKGEILANYHRCQPTPPALNMYLYNGRKHLEPGNELTVVETSVGTLGLLICSEIKVPELARIEMLMGAEILIAPIGAAPGTSKGMRFDNLGRSLTRSKFELFKAVAQTRSIENMVYTIITANIWDTESQWGACVTTPDGLVTDSEGAGVLYATLDMDRLRTMRNRGWSEDDFHDEPVRTLITDPAQHRDRRPDLYGLLTAPQPDAFDFFYHRENPDQWRKAFDRERTTGERRS